MGKLTDDAADQLESILRQRGLDVDKMASTLWLHDHTGKNVFIKLAVFGEQQWDHVERILMQKLYERYQNNWANVPNKSRIVFVCTWSPCIKCASELIPQLAKDLDAEERGISIKFIFREYYEKGKFTPSKHENAGTSLWETQKDTQKFYEKLCKKSGTIYQYLGRHAEAGVNMTKLIPVIQIKKLRSGSMTDVAEW